MNEGGIRRRTPEGQQLLQNQPLKYFSRIPLRGTTDNNLVKIMVLVERVDKANYSYWGQITASLISNRRLSQHLHGQLQTADGQEIRFTALPRTLILCVLFSLVWESYRLQMLAKETGIQMQKLQALWDEWLYFQLPDLRRSKVDLPVRIKDPGIP